MGKGRPPPIKPLPPLKVTVVTPQYSGGTNYSQNIAIFLGDSILGVGKHEIEIPNDQEKITVGLRILKTASISNYVALYVNDTAMVTIVMSSAVGQESSIELNVNTYRESGLKLQWKVEYGG